MIAPSTPAGKRVMAIAAAELEIRRRASASAKIAARGRLIDLDLADFVPAVRGAGYERPEHLAPLTDFFDRVSRGEVVRMLCSAPPQFGKSVVMSTGCARYVARQPDRPIIYATYGASLAEQKSREARDIAVECGVELRGDASSVDEWLTPQGGGMRARGVGGPTIGHPAKCFIGATRVQTPQGVKTIADVARGTGRTLVLSFDHAQGRPVWRSVLASQRSVSRSLVEIETVGGKRLRCTSDHPIFVLGRGYVPAGELRSNDLLRTANLRGVLPAGVEGGHSLPGLFPRPQALRGVCSLHVVRREDLQAKLRAREGETQRHPVGVLLSGVHGQALSGNDGCSMQGVRDIGTAALEQEVLFERLPDAGSASGEDQAVRGVRSEFSSGECSQSVLREEVRVGGAFEADARRGQFTFQDRGQLREDVPRDASARVGTGRESVRGVREAGEPLRGDPARPTNLSVDSIGASHRSRPGEQRAREPRHAVQDVPRGSPQVGVDSVAMVRELRGESDEVFDIEVEGTHNFFAEGLLVHNCFIVDDPHKDREEAESALLRQKTFDWYVSVAESRCHPDSSILVAHSRWHDDDLIGRLKELKKPDGAPMFEYVNLPAILEDGRPLWHQRPIDWLEPKQQFEHDWWSLWMGEPRKRGERIFKGQHYYDRLPIHYRIGKGIDLANSAKKSAHHSVAVVILEDLDSPPTARRYFVADVRRCHQLSVPDFCKELRSVPWPGPWRFDAASSERGSAQLMTELGIPVEDYLARVNKVVRSEGLAAAWNDGRVLLPRDAPWLREFADEVGSFTGGSDKSDDQVDAAASAFENLRTDGGEHKSVSGSGSRFGDDRGFG